jgi:hypothetical protein
MAVIPLASAQGLNGRLRLTALCHGDKKIAILVFHEDFETSCRRQTIRVAAFGSCHDRDYSA